MIAFCAVVTEELPKVMKSRPTLGVNEHTESRFTGNSAQFTNEENSLETFQWQATLQLELNLQ